MPLKQFKFHSSRTNLRLLVEDTKDLLLQPILAMLACTPAVAHLFFNSFPWSSQDIPFPPGHSSSTKPPTVPKSKKYTSLFNVAKFDEVPPEPSSKKKKI